MDLNKILGIHESYKMPEVLMQKLLSEPERIKLFENIKEELDNDLHGDILRDYYQQEHGDREKLKQDYTPDSVCEILSKICTGKDTVLDVCSGTGALSIAQYNQGNNKFVCEEYSERALPVLMLNMAIRNTNAEIRRKDVITRQTFEAYKLTAGYKYSDIEKIEPEDNPEQYSRIISNPPYSMRWNRISDDRMTDYGLPPAKAADYVFVLDIWQRLSDGGKAAVILPHGILFRGNSEGEIRQRLIEANAIDAVIGLPENLFLNTGIPVCILILSKSEKEEMLFIDASKLCIKSGKLNIMLPEHIDKVVETYNDRTDVPKLASLVSLEKIKENEYNLNIPRYVNTYEAPAEIDILAEVEELIRIHEEIKKKDKQLAKRLKELEYKIAGEEKEKFKQAQRMLIDFLESR